MAIALCAVGAVAVCAGVAWVLPPLGLICAGAFLLLAGLFLVEEKPKP